jgi:hypothetical protein
MQTYKKVKKTWLAPSLKAQVVALVALMRTQKFSALARLNFPIRLRKKENRTLRPVIRLPCFLLKLIWTWTPKILHTLFHAIPELPLFRTPIIAPNQCRIPLFSYV